MPNFVSDQNLTIGSNMQSRSVEEVRRLAIVAELTTNAVIITDQHKKILWVNDGFTRITGFEHDEVLGLNPGRFLQCPESDPETTRRMSNAINNGEGCRVELLNQGKDGRRYWLDIDIQPLLDESGQLTGFVAVESEITALVEARLRAEAAERRQRLVVDGADLGTWDWHIPSGEVTFNKRWCEMLGYKHEEVESDVGSWEMVIHPEDHEPAMNALTEHFEGRSDIYRFEHRLKHRDGSIVWVLDSGRVYEWDAENNPIRMAGIHLDVTERRLAEERFELAATGSSVGIWDWNIDSGSKYLSPRWKSMLGYEDHELKNCFDTWTRLLHPDDRERCETVAEAHFKQRIPYELDYRLRHKHGEYRWFHVRGQAVWNADGTPLRMAGSLEDIHERKSLELSRGRLASIVEASEDAILSISLEGVIRIANPSAAAMFGFEPGQLAGKYESILIPEDCRQSELNAVNRIGESTRSPQYETRRVRRDGKEVEVSIVASHIFDENGKISGLAKIIRDITDRREKTALQESHRELAQLNGLLANQNQKLEEMSDRAHRFVDDVSHEFRTPLTVIKEYTSIIMDGLGGDVSEQQQDWLRTIDVATVDLNTMVEDFLDSSKLRAGRLRVDRRPVNIRKVFDGVRLMLERKAQARQIRLVERIGPGLPTVFADEEKVRRIIMNLATNAIKFSPTGSEICISAERDNTGDVEITITDQGQGLSASDLGLLFERFKQLPNAMSPSVKGFGLGLNIARQLVWLNLGKLSVESTLGEGSAFRFTLPPSEPEIIVDRFLERLHECEDCPGRIGALHIRLANANSNPSLLQHLLGVSTRPSDISLLDRDGRACLLFGPTGSIEKWVKRLESEFHESDSLSSEPLHHDLEIKIIGSWSFIDERDIARSSLLAHIHRDRHHG